MKAERNHKALALSETIRVNTAFIRVFSSSYTKNLCRVLLNLSLSFCFYLLFFKRTLFVDKQQQRKNIQLDIKQTISDLQEQLRLKHWDQSIRTSKKLNLLIVDLKNIDDLIIDENMLFIRREFSKESKAHL
jgi:hypothetical protein